MQYIIGTAATRLHNSKYQCILHIPQTNLLIPAAKQELYKKAYKRKTLKNFQGEKSRGVGQQTERKKKDKTERVAGLGRRARKGIVKWTQMTALRFQIGGRHQTSPASLRGTDRKKKETRFELKAIKN